MKKINGGFTLTELLTVVAILGVLVGTTIPLFSGHEERVQSSTCETNCRNMKAELDLEVLLDGDDPAEVFKQIKQGYVCPNGGNYILDYDRNSGSIRVYCTFHSGIAAVNPEFINKVFNVMSSKKTDEISIGSNIDSTYSKLDDNSNSKKLMDAMKSEGFDPIGGMWRLERNKSAGGPNEATSFYWSSADPNTVAPGDTVYIIKYNYQTYNKPEYRGCYSVYTCTIAENEKNGNIYNVLTTERGVTELSTSKSVKPADKKDFNTMMDVYNAAVAANGGSPVIRK